jgi:hypothetical protein
MWIRDAVILSHCKKCLESVYHVDRIRTKSPTLQKGARVRTFRRRIARYFPDKAEEARYIGVPRKDVKERQASGAYETKDQ